MTEPVVISWSGGKDSALALHAVQAAGRFDILALLTTVTEGFDRISMHGVRRVLLEQQALALGLPLRQVLIPQKPSNEQYEAQTLAALAEYRARGVQTVVFGDLFLQDIRAYRDRLLARIGMRADYPVWDTNTAQLARDFIATGFKAVLICVNPKALDARFAGRLFDDSLLAELPTTVDPCGENGEFHTFVFDGPNFRRPVPFTRGEVVERDGFVFCDLIESK